MPDQQQTNQIPAAAELRISRDGIYCAIRGTEHDSLTEVVSAAHQETRWAWDRDEMALIDDQRPQIIHPR